MKQWYTVAETAERLGVTRQRVHTLMREGALPAHQPGGQWVHAGRLLWLIEAQAVETFQRKKHGRPRKGAAA